MDELTLSGAGIVLAAAAAVLAVLGWRGVFSRRAFEGAPRRGGRLGLVDLFIGLGLVLVGPGAAVVLLARVAPPPPDELRGLLWMLLASQIGAIPAIAYVLVRASMAVEGGIGGFGLGARALPGGLALALVGIVATVPLVALAGIVVHFISILLGQETPTIAHDLLRVIAEAPWGPVRWGLILSAVLIAPLVEEIMFRGLVQTSLVQSPLIRGRWTAIFIASVLFMLMHITAVFVPAEAQPEPQPRDEPMLVMQASWPAGGAEPAAHPLLARAPSPAPEAAPEPDAEMRFAWQALPVLLLLSICLGYAYERTGNLWVPIGIHALFNGMQIAIAIANAEVG